MTETITSRSAPNMHQSGYVAPCKSPDAPGAVATLLCVHAGANSKQFDEALASLCGQTYPNLRLYIYCDGPLTPDLENVLSARMHGRDEKDRVLRGAQSEGLPSGLNALINEALKEPDIEFMARMDADDISVAERIYKQVQFLNENPEVFIVGSWCVEFTQSGASTFYKRMPTKHEDLTNFMVYRSPFNHPSVLFRRQVFEKGFRYDPSLKIMQDYDLWSRLAYAGFIFANIPEFLLWFRLEENFFARRAGFSRASKEINMRIQYARSMGKLRVGNFLKYAGLFLIRIAPVWAKKLSYRHLRKV